MGLLPFCFWQQHLCLYINFVSLDAQQLHYFRAVGPFFSNIFKWFPRHSLYLLSVISVRVVPTPNYTKYSLVEMCSHSHQTAQYVQCVSNCSLCFRRSRTTWAPSVAATVRQDPVLSKRAGESYRPLEK